MPKVEWLGRIGYENGLALQEKLVLDTIASGVEYILLLEHDPVFTIGLTRDESSLLDQTQLPFPVHKINRAGQATYHGPGQLVCYPILDLKNRGRDLHKYLRFLEHIVIEVMKEYSLAGQRREGLTGVWVANRKIASIGVGVRRWISMHGFALNVASELPGFSNIIPCGISEVVMTSLEAETHKQLITSDVANVTKDVFLSQLAKLSSHCF